MSIEEERAIVNAATPAPWWYDEDEHCWRLHGVAMTLPSPFDGFPEQHVGKQILKARKQDDQMMPYWPEPADAKFIACARTMYPLALDVIEAVARALPARHQAHYAHCGCLDDSSECCSPVCECHVLAAFEEATE